MTEGNEKEYEVGIRIACNTLIPCLQAIKAKGDSIRHFYLGDGPNDWDHPQWDAEKGNWLFRSTSPAELLGLIAMWEVRGDDWHIKNGESALYDQLVESALMYDRDGNLVDM